MEKESWEDKDTLTIKTVFAINMHNSFEYNSKYER